MTGEEPAEPPRRAYDAAPTMPPDLAPPSDRDDLSSLVTRCILAFEQEGESAVEGLLAANPAIATEARAQLLALRDAGLLAPPMPDPEQIGPYRVLRRLGSGAVGSVYLAVQDQPVRRQVAIKVIRPGMDSREVLARFAVERQALALLDHPNVARVLDAGTTPDGRPYLCMDYVAGQPITRYCDERALSLEQRLELLAQVGDAVHAAHQKGILHRDLKPSNILVGDRDGRPWPTVIDFGVAKSLGPRLLDVTQLTGHGRLIGTPEYMSPEQAANEVDVDTRTDVHALGVMLYELLTGRLPFPSERLRRAAPAELLRILREEEPPAPSAAVGDGSAGAEERARRRRLSAANLQRTLRGELDWIVQKAIEKDRNRRYGMAADLAADVRNHLRGEPVGAGPRTTWYRWRKLVQRHRLQVGSLAAVLVALLLGLLTSLTFYSEALAKAKESEASLDVALEAVERMVKAGESRLNVVPRMDEVRRELLAEALALHRRLAAASGENRLQLRTARALAGLGNVQAQLGEYEPAIHSLVEARRILADLPEGRTRRTEVRLLDVDLAFSQSLWMETLGKPAAAWHAQRDEAFRGVEALLAEGEPTADERLLGARIFARVAAQRRGNDAAGARALFDRSVALLAPVLASATAPPEALADAFAVLARHADFLVEIGDPTAAIAATERLHKLTRSQLERDVDPLAQARFLPTIVEFSTVWYRTEQFDRVVEELAPVIAARRALVRDFPAVPNHRSGLGIALVNTALAQERLGKMAEARTALLEALDLYDQLVAAHPAAEDYREQMLRVVIDVAHHDTMRARYGMEVDWQQAEHALARAADLATEERAEASGRWAELLAEVARMRGTVRGLQGRNEDAAAAQREAVQRYEQLWATQPDSVWVGARLVDVRENLARSLLALGDTERAAPLVAAAMELHTALLPKLPSNDQVANKRRELVELGVRIDIAGRRFDAALAGMQRYLELGPAPDFDWIGKETVAKLCLVGARTAGDDAAWRTRLAQAARDGVANALASGANRNDPSSPMVAVMRANTLQLLVTVEREFGTPAAAAAAQRGVVDGYRLAFDARQNARNRGRVEGALKGLIELLRAAGDTGGAEAVEQELAALPAAR